MGGGWGSVSERILKKLLVRTQKQFLLSTFLSTTRFVLISHGEMESFTLLNFYKNVSRHSLREKLH